MTLSYEFVCDGELKLPLNSGAKVGVMNVYGDNQLLFSTDLYTMDNIVDRTQAGYLKNYVGDWQVKYDVKTKQIFGIKMDGFPS